MPYIPHTEDDRRTMLATIGAKSIEDLFKDVPEDLVYGVVKTVLENNAQMVKGHASAKETLTENWNRNTFLPFHPGAVRYYKEKGINIPANLIAR